MLWYDGPIENAIYKVKSTGSLLLIFVKGDDKLSREYESCLNKETGLNAGTCVAVKVTHNSTALQQLKQIYVHVPIPSVFLIQNNGIPFHVIATNKISEISGAISKTVIQLNNNFEKKNKKAVTESTKKNLEEPPAKSSHHAKNIGLKVIDVSEVELKQRLNEIRAFPRFLLIDPSSTLEPVPVPVPVPTAPPVQPPKTHSARIQFRLPNNETPSWEFPDLSTLRDVRAYISEKINLPQNFKFIRAYPRTAFTPRDECKTLSDLSLTPNATLIVVPVKVENKKVQANPSEVVSRPFFFSTVLNVLLLPLITLIKFFKKHIFGERAEINNDDDGPPRPVRQNRTSPKFGSNIHGFKFDRDDSDEHPDNGNSTQQSYNKK